EATGLTRKASPTRSARTRRSFRIWPATRARSFSVGTPNGCSASEALRRDPVDDPRIQELIRLREEARAQKDFARADQIRDEIAAAGYVLRDTPGGSVVEKGVTFERRHPASIESLLHEQPVLAFSIHVLYEGFPTDLDRFLAGLRAHNDTSSTEVVIVDNASAEGEDLETMADDLTRVVHLDREV